MKQSMITGFNWGQFFHYLTLEYNYHLEVPEKMCKTIIDVCPREMLDNWRHSGTMSNHQLITQPGYGIEDEVGGLWQQLANRKLSALNKIKFGLNVLTGRKLAAIGQVLPLVQHSYLYNLLHAYKQLGGKTMAFTANTHSPYLGRCHMDESIESVAFVDRGTNLISVELGNESYLYNDIIGISNNRVSAINTVNKYISFLKEEYIPALDKAINLRVRGIALGLPICDNRVVKYSVWNEAMLQLYAYLDRSGYQVFLAPHIYTKDYTNAGIREEMSYQMESLYGNYDGVRITEWNADSSAGNLKTQSEVRAFVANFHQIAMERGVKACYYHTVYTQAGAHFSFIK